MEQFDESCLLLVLVELMEIVYIIHHILTLIPKLFNCPSFPTLVNGKVDRQSLIKSYEESLVFETSYTDDELNEDGCTNDESVYAKARVILNAVCSVIGTLSIENICFISNDMIEINK